MGFGLYTLLEAGLLFINAIAILNEQRFLSKFGLGQNKMQGYGEQPGTGSVSTQLMTLIRSVQMVMRFPLIFCNLTVIVLLLLFG